jgi:hypothetical protein
MSKWNKAMSITVLHHVRTPIRGLLYELKCALHSSFIIYFILLSIWSSEGDEPR